MVAGAVTLGLRGAGTEGLRRDAGVAPSIMAHRTNAGVLLPLLQGDVVMTMEEFGDFVGKVVAYAIGIPLILVSLLVAYWLVVVILRLAGVVELPDPIDWLPQEWTKDLPIPR